MTISSRIIKSSFRDPSGFVFLDGGTIYRQINKCYREHYEYLMGSGLYDALTEAGLLLNHEEVDKLAGRSELEYKVIRPEQIDFLTYPYEWCFSQLRDAAPTTLAIQNIAFRFGMTLKDASAYNVQFHQGKPIFIDTLSFEIYEEGHTWNAYRQFCQHFLAPLALMSCRDIRLSQLLRNNIDGIPLDLASSLLPIRSRLRFSLLSHIYLHSISQRRYADKRVGTGRRISQQAFLGLIDSLESAVRGLSYEPAGTVWSDYYSDTNYSDDTLRQKESAVADFLDAVLPRSVWDIGSNTGRFSRLASSKGIQTLSIDSDPAAVEKNYLECLRIGDTKCLPLLADLTNPSPGIGWRNEERIALINRGTPDCVMALALVHHLVISNNVPPGLIAEFFAGICHSLIIEFVPKADSQVVRLLRSRQDIFEDYSESGFADAFRQYFTISRKAPLSGSERVLFLMESKGN
ncbi:MAG: SAM-dependent methyltransferase [candidate division Zixibacteria bacterium]|nr:SAM-dependent methyltransferase [candidate division Zixibacteria bacterium]MBU1471645.1 SAM-dependent methyltransferase [candidate division Zixibacteria bacterium]MBU2626291.1 SAM-dependent methyltransferase [candidate division Zixibacteria bacterium]